MTPDRNKGLWLCPKPEGSSHGWLISSLGAAMACVMLLLTIAKLIDFPGSALPMVLTGAALCILCGFLKYLKKETLFYIVVLAALVAMVLLAGKTVTNAMGLLWNSLAQVRTGATGRLLPAVQVWTDAAGALLIAGVFLGAIGAVVCCGLSRRCRPALAVGLPLLLAAGMAFFRKDGEFVLILPVLAVSLLLLLTAEDSGNLRTPGILWCLLITAVLVVTAFALSGSASARTWAESTSQSLRKAFHSHRYETDYTTLPEGDFTAYEPEGETAHPALAVTMEQPEPLFLRGFTGANLEGDCWKQSDPAILLENKDLLYWLNTNAFHIQTQFSAAAEALESETNLVTVQNIGACSYYRYVPFTLCPDGTLEEENLNPDSLRQIDSRLDTYRVLSGGGERISELVQTLQNENTEAVLRYRKAESAYRDFVYQHYLEISPEALELLREQWDQTARQYGGVDQMDAQQAQACVLEFLQKCFSKDARISLPLPQAAGTDYQYATVAVLTLRYFGIPARYAEGYRITEAMVAQTKPNETIQVDSSCAGAWAEVYQDGVGWLPMSLTQGMDPQGESLGQQKDEAAEDGSADLQEGQELEETPENPVQDPQPQGGSVVKLRKVVEWGLLLILLAVLALLLLFWLRRKRIQSKRMARFYLRERAEATAWIFAHGTLLLEKLGYQRGNGSMEALQTAISNDLGSDYAREFLKMNELNQRALFSSHPIEESQWQAMLAFYEVTLQQLKQRVGWLRRMWLQWILCLF